MKSARSWKALLVTYNWKHCPFCPFKCPREGRRRGKDGTSSRMQRGVALGGGYWVQPPPSGTLRCPGIWGRWPDQASFPVLLPDVRQGPEQRQDLERNCAPLLPTQCPGEIVFWRSLQHLKKFLTPTCSPWCLSELIGNSPSVFRALL